MQHPNEIGMFAFQHLHDFAFRLFVFPFREHGHLDAVAMKGLSGVVRGDIDILTRGVVKDHVGLARRFHIHSAFNILSLGTVVLQILWIEHIPIGTLLQELALLEQIHQDIVNHVFTCSVFDAEHLADLLVIHRTEGVLTKNAENRIGEYTQFVFQFSLFAHEKYVKLIKFYPIKILTVCKNNEIKRLAC